MPTIQFDVLVPQTNAQEVQDSFQSALDILVDREKLGSGSCTHESAPEVSADVEEQLRQTYRDEHEERDLEDATVHRYNIEATGASSLNQLAMGLSRVLTPSARLVRDPAALQRETEFEVPAIYPWTVEILR